MEDNIRFLDVDFVGPILIVGVCGDEFCDIKPEYCPILLQALSR